MHLKKRIGNCIMSQKKVETPQKYFFLVVSMNSVKNTDIPQKRKPLNVFKGFPIYFEAFP